MTHSAVTLYCFALGVLAIGPHVHASDNVLVVKRDVAPPLTHVYDSAKLLNDLALSPYWKVVKSENGDFQAWARVLDPPPLVIIGKPRFFFDEFSKANGRLEPGWQISDGFCRLESVSASVCVIVLFARPVEGDLVSDDGKVTLTIDGLRNGELTANSASTLIVPLDKKVRVFLRITELGKDPTRRSTFFTYGRAMMELEHMCALPRTYRVDDVYQPFFKAVFGLPLHEHDMRQIEHLQRRDTYYGYLQRKRSQQGDDPISLRISHPVYCRGECTRPSARERKAEFLGRPYSDCDHLFFCFEDNAIFLQSQYNSQFGVFSGKESFLADVELLTGGNKVLLNKKMSVQGWEQ